MNLSPSDLDSPTTMGAEQTDSSSAAGTALRPSFPNQPLPPPHPRPLLFAFEAEAEKETEAKEEEDNRFFPSDLDYPTTMGAEQTDSSSAAGTALRPSFSNPPLPRPLPRPRATLFAFEAEAEKEAEEESKPF